MNTTSHLPLRGDRRRLLPGRATHHAGSRGARAILIAASAPIALTSCSYLDKATEGMTPYGSEEARTNAYIEHCLNSDLEGLDSFAADYFGAAPIETGPVDGAAVKTAIYAPTRNEVCDAAIKESEGSDTAVDVAARGLAVSFDAVYPVIAEVSTYYGRDNYLDDGLAGGRDLHTKFVAAFGQVATAREPFEAEVAKSSDADNAEALEAANSADADLRTLAQASMAQAETAINELADDQEAMFATADWAKVDVAAYLAAVDTLSATWDRAVARAASTTEDDDILLYGSFASSMERLLASFLDVKRRLETPAAYSAEELAQLAEGFDIYEFGFEHVLELYNKAVNSYNQM